MKKESEREIDNEIERLCETRKRERERKKRIRRHLLPPAADYSKTCSTKYSFKVMLNSLKNMHIHSFFVFVLLFHK